MANKRKGLNDIIAALGDTYVTRNVGFFLFLAILGVLYIANSHQAMKRVREINHMTEVVKKKRWYYIQSLSDAMQLSKLSRVKEGVKDMGLNEILEPPQIIVKTTTEDKNGG